MLVAGRITFAGGVSACPFSLSAGICFALLGSGDGGFGAAGSLDGVVAFAGGVSDGGLRGAHLRGGVGVRCGDLGGPLAAGLPGGVGQGGVDQLPDGKLAGAPAGKTPAECSSW